MYQVLRECGHTVTYRDILIILVLTAYFSSFLKRPMDDCQATRDCKNIQEPSPLCRAWNILTDLFLKEAAVSTYDRIKGCMQ